MRYKIIKEDFIFRAVNTATGARSMAFTSASQAGGYIQRLGGKAAHAEAAAEFLASLNKGG